MRKCGRGSGVVCVTTLHVNLFSQIIALNFFIFFFCSFVFIFFLFFFVDFKDTKGEEGFEVGRGLFWKQGAPYKGEGEASKAS